MYNFANIKPGGIIEPLVTRTAQLHAHRHEPLFLSMHVPSVLFLVTVQQFCLDYGLLLELHTLTLAARSYVLLLDTCSQFPATLLSFLVLSLWLYPLSTFDTVHKYQALPACTTSVFAFQSGEAWK